MKMKDLIEKRVDELIVGAPKGSQKDARLKPGTDKPEKYMRGGEWEAYREPQGIGSKSGQEVTKGSTFYKRGKKKVKEQKASKSYGGLRGHALRAAKFIKEAVDNAWQEAYERREKLDRKEDVVPIAARALKQYVRENKIQNADTFMRKVWSHTMGDKGVYQYPPDLLDDFNESIGPLFTRGDTGTGGHGVGAVPPPPIRKPEPKIPKTEAPSKFVKKSVKKQNTDSRPAEITEMVRRPIIRDFNADYELKTDDGEETIGVATVNSGVLELLAVRDDIEEDYKGHLLSKLVGSIIRDADLADAGLSIELVSPEDEGMKRFLERFGFRHTGGGVMKRNAGAISPPSVVDV